jgi:hypothetical protein
VRLTKKSLTQRGVCAAVVVPYLSSLRIVSGDAHPHLCFASHDLNLERDRAPIFDHDERWPDTQPGILPGPAVSRARAPISLLHFLATPLINVAYWFLGRDAALKDLCLSRGCRSRQGFESRGVETWSLVS